MITSIVISRAFVRACIARRPERSILATMPGCTIVWLRKRSRGGGSDQGHS